MEKKYLLGTAEPPIRWKEPWEYEAWKVAVVGKEKPVPEAWLQRLYAEQWEPNELYQVLGRYGAFGAANEPKKRVRRTALTLDNVQVRIAKAIWVECGRLVLRYQTPEARAYVNQMREQAQRAAGIQTY